MTVKNTYKKTTLRNIQIVTLIYYSIKSFFFQFICHHAHNFYPPNFPNYFYPLLALRQSNTNPQNYKNTLHVDSFLPPTLFLLPIQGLIWLLHHFVNVRYDQSGRQQPQ